MKVALALAVTLSVCGLPRAVAVGAHASLAAGNIKVAPFLSILWVFAYVCWMSTTGAFYFLINANYRSTLIRYFHVMYTSLGCKHKLL